MNLRPYQDDALAAVSAAFRRGRRAPLLVAPTGAGKTVMAGTMCARHLARSASNRLVWLTHRTELRDQAADTLDRLGCDMSRASVESIQSLVRRASMPPATMVVQDECHHMMSDLWSKLNIAWPGAFRVGLTATPERGDGRGLKGAFDDIVVAATPAKLTEMGFLVPCRVVRPGKLLTSSKIAQPPVGAYLEHAAGRQAVVFCSHILDAEACLADFRAEGIKAAMVTAKTPWSERCATIKAFRDGLGQVLVNVNVLTEGFDAPETSCCIIARGCGTPGMYVQMVGRALRPAPGKADAVLLDLRGISWLHGDPIDDREYSLDGKGIRLKSDVVARFCKICSAVLADGVPVCPECGSAPKPLKPSEVTFDPLEEMRRLAAVPESKKVGQLAYWIRSGRANGNKPIAAYMKYRGVYQTMPSDKIKREAERRAR